MRSFIRLAACALLLAVPFAAPAQTAAYPTRPFA